MGQKKRSKEIVKFATAKTADETWAMYVNRLYESEYISEAHFKKWQDGKAVNIKRSVRVTRYRAAIRSRVVDENTNKLEDYAVAIPIAESVPGKMKLPSMGASPDDEQFDGFLDSDGQKIQTLVPEPTTKELKVLRKELEKTSLQFVSRKTSEETWQEYVARLQESKLISAAEQKRWLAGERVSVTKKVNRTVMHNQSKIRGGKTVVVSVPVNLKVTMILKLSAKDARKEDATNKGFVYE